MEKTELEDLIKSKIENSDVKVETREGEDEQAKHFKLYVRSPEFEGLSKLDRRRKIYDVLGDKMGDEIHAVEIKAVSPSEDKQ